MDSAVFDGIARLLGGAATRRAGIAAALAALGSRLLPGASEAAKEAPEPEGPCGKKGKANRCHKHSQCCTGYCRKKKGKKGRCRCAPAKVSCTNKTICCDGLTCTDGKCTPTAACDVCQSGCPYQSVNDAFAAAADGATITIDSGTYPTGIVLDKSITLEACAGATGVILTLDGKVQTPDSYSVIITDEYGSTESHTLTLIGLELTGTSTSNSETLVYLNTSVAVVADGCTAATATGAFWLYGDVNHSFTDTTVTGCSYGIYIESNGNHSFTDSTISGCSTCGVEVHMDQGVVVFNECIVTGNDSYGARFYGPVDTGSRANVTYTVTNSVFSDNASTGAYFIGGVSTITGGSVTGNGNSDNYGGLGLSDGALTVTDVTISGNEDTEWGGGVYVYAETASSSLTLAGSTSVTGNTAPRAAGVGAQITTPNGISISGTSTRVSGNTNTEPTENWQCATQTDGGSWVEVPNCNFI